MVENSNSNTQLFLPAARAPSSLSVREFFLDVTAGPSPAKSFGPLIPPIRIGSALGNDLVVEDPTVSRFHCAIERSAEGPLIIDSGSKNGTLLGKERIREAYLQEGSVIRLGQTELSVRLSGVARTLEISALSTFGALHGVSDPMRVLFATLLRLARANAPVLIEGETGTGKELVARALHSEGPRSAKPFVVVDCGAIAPTLVESELFGHARGAFTGADAARLGAFVLADSGTIFLDEIGELPLPLQPKLLRVLETAMVKPLGSGREQPVSVRVVAATHRDLRHMVNEGTFREDLFFRLSVCPVLIPPLRERLEDLPVLAKHFLIRALSASQTSGKTSPDPTPETLLLLKERSWHGNVRELRNAVERAVILGDPEEVERGDLARALRQQSSVERRSDPTPCVLEEAKRRFEREYLVRLMTQYNNDLARAAASAGVHPKSLQRLIRRHSLRDA